MVRTPPDKKPQSKKKPDFQNIVPINDPYQINARLQRQVSELLKQLEEGEHITMRERFQALAAIARVQYIFMNLRKEKFDDDNAAGSSVRKYATAFKPNDPRGRKKVARSASSAPEPDGDTWFEREDDDGDDAA